MCVWLGITRINLNWSSKKNVNKASLKLLVGDQHCFPRLDTSALNINKIKHKELNIFKVPAKLAAYKSACDQEPRLFRT